MAAAGSTCAGTCTYQIDGENRICFVNDFWSVFARDNHGEHLLPQCVLRTSLWEYLTGTATRYVYVKALEFVRATREPLSFEFRCDGPSVLRVLRMSMTPLARGTVRFETTVLHEEPRPAIKLLDADCPRDARVIPLCGWCFHAQTLQMRWMPLEEAARRVDRSAAGSIPQLFHTVCPACHAHLRELMVMPENAPHSVR